MADAGARQSGLGHGLKVVGAVLAITAASMIGLHDWADGAATHEAGSSTTASHDMIE